MNPIRVLIVDDVFDTRESIRTLLEFTPEFEVVGEAADGYEAVDQAVLLEPDCILMDINMPGQDGIEATRLIHAQVPEIAVVMMSVHGEQEYLRNAKLAGARDYLTKPFSADDLVDALRRAAKGLQPTSPIDTPSMK